MAEVEPFWHDVEGHPRARYRSPDWATDSDRIGGLFRDYRRWIADHADSGGASATRVKAGLDELDRTIEKLPGPYGPPTGDVLLWYEGDQLVACGALRSLSPGTAEFARIYVRSDYRGEEFGKPYVRTFIARARELGYRRLRSYVLGSMTSAIEFFSELGFRRITAYWPHPAEEPVFFELEL